ncbi:MAG: hypothetical protein ACTSRP_18130 [Candidatus Helarchaeota archaeon]
MDIYGLDPEWGFWASSILTSGRESLSGMGRSIWQGTTKSDKANLKLNIQNARINAIMKKSQKYQQNKDIESKIEELLNIKRQLEQDREELREHIKTEFRTGLYNGLLLIATSFLPFGLLISGTFSNLNIIMGGLYNKEVKKAEQHQIRSNILSKESRENLRNLIIKPNLQQEQIEQLGEVATVINAPRINPLPITLIGMTRDTADSYVQNKLGKKGYRAPTGYEQAWLGYVTQKQDKISNIKANLKKAITINRFAEYQSNLELSLIENPTSITPIFKSEEAALADGDDPVISRVQENGKLKFISFDQTSLNKFLGTNEELTIDFALKASRKLHGMKKEKVVFRYGDQILAPRYAVKNQRGDALFIENEMKLKDILDFIGYIPPTQTEYKNGKWRGSQFRLEILYESEIKDEILSLNSLLYSNNPEALFYIQSHFNYYFKNHFNSLISTELGIKAFELFHEKIVPIRDTLLNEYGFLDVNGNIDKSEIKGALRAIFNRYLARNIDEYHGKVKEIYKNFLNGLFRDIFEIPLKITPISEIKEFLEERLYFAILAFVMQQTGFYNPEYKLEDMTINLYNYLISDMNIENLNNIFNVAGYGKDLFLFALSENFLYAGAKKLGKNKAPGAYFGYTAEVDYLFKKMQWKIPQWFDMIIEAINKNELSEKGLDELLASSRLSVGKDSAMVYTKVSKNYGDPEYPNVFGLDYSNIQFYRGATSRLFDGGGVFDFLVFIVSTEIKQTWYKSIAASQIQRETKTNLVDAITEDTLSSMIWNIMKVYKKGKDFSQLPKRYVQMVATYGPDLEAAEMTYEKFYTRNIFTLRNKVAPHELFMMRLIELINLEFDYYRIYADKEISTDNIKNIIEELFTYDYFIDDVITQAYKAFPDGAWFLKTKIKDSKTEVIKEIYKLIIKNMANLMYITESGRVSLRLRIEHNPHFQTNEKIKVSDFPSSGRGKAYLLDLSSSQNEFMREIVADSDLQKEKSLVVCHNLNYPNRIILVPAKRLSELSKTNIEEGYLDENGVVHHGIFVSDNGANKLVSKLKFNSESVNLRDKYWASKQYKYDLLFNDQGEFVGYQSECFMAYLIMHGQEITAGLQDTIAILDNIESFKAILPKIPLKEMRYKIKEEILIPSIKRDLDMKVSSKIQDKIIAINNYITFMEQRFNQKRRKFLIPDEIFQLDREYFITHSGERILYSNQHILNVLIDLKPQNIEDITILHVNEDNTLDIHLKPIGILSKKAFFKNWLSIIKQHLSRTNPDTNPSRFFEKYRNLVSRLEFSNVAGKEDDFIVDDSNNDKYVIINLIRILEDILSRPGYSLLITGQMNFIKEGDKYGIYYSKFIYAEPNDPSKEEFFRLMNKIGVRPLIHRNPYRLEPLGIHYYYHSIAGLQSPSEMFGSFILLGHDQIFDFEIKGKKQSILINSYAYSEFLKILFNGIATTFKFGQNSEFSGLDRYNYFSSIMNEYLVNKYTKLDNINSRIRGLSELENSFSQLADLIVQRISTVITEKNFLENRPNYIRLSYERYKVLLEQKIRFSILKALVTDARSFNEFKEKIASYILSNGLIGFTGEDCLDFSYKSLGIPDLDTLVNHLYKIPLPSRASWFSSTFYEKFFKDFTSNSINYLQQATEKLFLEPKDIFLNCKEDIIWIFNFLKYIAMEKGTIRIYGYRLSTEGLSYKDTEGKLNYYPSKNLENVDRGFGISNRENSRYFEISYDDATGNVRSFDLDDFKLFLGALLADAQTFIIRTAADHEGNSTMGANEVLFAFNFFCNRLEPSNIVGNRRFRAPTTSNGVMTAADRAFYNNLAYLWESFMINNKISIIHRYKEDSEFFENIKDVGYLDSESSDINRLSN